MASLSPFIPALRLLPPTLREKIFYRFLNSRQETFADCFERVRLSFADAEMLDLVPGDVISGSIASCGFYEPDLSREILKRAQQGGTLLDVGANLGYFSLLWAAANPVNRAISVEAAPRNIAKLSQNFAFNAMEDRLKLIPKAAGEENGIVSFDPGPEEQTGWGGIAKGESETTITVPLVRLDEVLNEPVDVMKVDVEGAELQVFRGCEKLLSEGRIKEIFFEEQPSRTEELGTSLGSAESYLKEFGYRVSGSGAEMRYAVKS